MVAPVSVAGDQLAQLVARLVALSPGDGHLAGLVRGVCARALSLPSLPVAVAVDGPASESEAVVAEFAEQFSVDVAAITDDQRSRLWKHLGDSTFSVVVAIYIADFVPRVCAGLDALGVGERFLGWVTGPTDWDDATDPSDAVFNDFLPSVARMRALDPVISELVRLRGAGQHNCRLCKSLRESAALDAGGSEALYADIERFETSELVTLRAKAALRYADALIWTPAHLAVDAAAEVRSRFSDAEAVELTLDIMRNASNRVAVSLVPDEPRAKQGTERYHIGADGQTVFR